MRSLLLLPLLLLLLLHATPAPAQTAGARPGAASDVLFRMGAREVSVPPPAGFIEAASRSQSLKEFFQATEAPALDLLAIHVPSEVMDRIARGEHAEMDFYTKVSVAKNLREREIAPQFFAEIVSELRANSARLLDLNSPGMQAQLKSQNKNLSELLREETRVDLSQPVYLGEVESTPNSYGMLIIMKVNLQSGGAQARKTLVSAACAVRVRERVLWVYAYKTFKSDADVDALRSFTKRWLADIIRANP